MYFEGIRDLTNCRRQDDRLKLEDDTDLRHQLVIQCHSPDCPEGKFLVNKGFISLNECGEQVRSVKRVRAYYVLTPETEEEGAQCFSCAIGYIERQVCLRFVAARS